MTGSQRQIENNSGENDETIIDIGVDDKTDLAEDEKKIEDEILRQFNADGEEKEWRITVKKVDARTKKQATCFILTPEEIHTVFDRLNSEYGPGVYRAYVTCNNELKRNLEYRIAAPIAKPITATAPAGSPIMDIGAVLRDNNTQLIDALESRNPQTNADPMAMFTAMMGAIASMKEVFAPPPPADNAIDTLLRGIELADKLKGDGGGLSIMDGIVKIADSDLGKAAVEQMQQTGAQKEQISGAAPQQNPALTAPQNTPVVDQNLPAGLQNIDPNLIVQIAQQIRFWAFHAIQNKNDPDKSHPATYAEMALDNYPPEAITMILDRPDLQEIVFHFAPDAQQHWGWFEALRNEVRELLTEPPEEAQNMVNGKMETPENVPDGSTAASAPVNADENSGRQSGDSGDAGNNAPASADGESQSSD